MTESSVRDRSAPSHAENNSDNHPVSGHQPPHQRALSLSLASPPVHLVHETVAGVPERLEWQPHVPHRPPDLLRRLGAQRDHLPPGPLDGRVKLHEP